jgi:hypothetical protein
VKGVVGHAELAPVARVERAGSGFSGGGDGRELVITAAQRCQSSRFDLQGASELEEPLDRLRIGRNGEGKRTGDGRNVVADEMLLPWRASTKPSAPSTLIASRMTPRLTPKVELSSRSVGNRSPLLICLLRIDSAICRTTPSYDLVTVIAWYGDLPLAMSSRGCATSDRRTAPNVVLAFVIDMPLSRTGR